MTLGAIDPDEVGLPPMDKRAAEDFVPSRDDSKEVRFSHVLQFLRNSNRSLATYNVVEQQYRHNGKLLWANHVAFCAAGQKSNSFLDLTGRLYHVSPEVPLIPAVLLLLVQVVAVRRGRIRPVGNEFVADARALVEAIEAPRPGEDKPLALLRQRLLRTPHPVPFVPASWKRLETNLKPFELGMAKALLEREQEAKALREQLDRNRGPLRGRPDYEPLGNR